MLNGLHFHIRQLTPHISGTRDVTEYDFFQLISLNKASFQTDLKFQTEYLDVCLFLNIIFRIFTHKILLVNLLCMTYNKETSPEIMAALQCVSILTILICSLCTPPPHNQHVTEV